MTEASTHAYKSAGAIVEEKMRDHIVPGDFNLPNPDNLIRAANRPAEPTELNVEVSLLSKYINYQRKE